MAVTGEEAEGKMEGRQLRVGNREYLQLVDGLVAELWVGEGDAVEAAGRLPVFRLGCEGFVAEIEGIVSRGRKGRCWRGEKEGRGNAKRAGEPARKIETGREGLRYREDTGQAPLSGEADRRCAVFLAPR